MAEYITQFVYMDEFISPDISGEVILKKQLLFENLRPILISSSSPYTLLHNLEDSAIEDKFGNNYSILSYSTSDVLFITLLPVTRNNLFLGYLANYYVYLYAVFFIVIIVISYFFSRSLSAPLVHLSQVAERMAQLDFDVHANVNTPDQLGTIALFGSYGWGDGEWMRTWEDTCRADGAQLEHPSVICQESPDAEAITQCRALGAALA